MQNPRAIVVGSESEGNVITRNATVHNVALHWVVVVVGVAAGATDDVKGVSVQMDRVLETSMIQIWSENAKSAYVILKLTGEPAAPPGKEISTV